MYPLNSHFLVQLSKEDKLVLPEMEGLHLTGSFTVALWVRPDDEVKVDAAPEEIKGKSYFCVEFTIV